jgi:hypothetical protein
MVVHHATGAGTLERNAHEERPLHGLHDVDRVVAYVRILFNE